MSVSDDRITVSGTNFLFVDLRDWRICIRFGIVDKLAALILIGTSYMDWFMKSILPLERMTFLVHSGPVAVSWAYAPVVRLIKTMGIAQSTPKLSDQSATLHLVAKKYSFF